MQSGNLQKEGLSERVTIVAQGGQIVRSKPMTQDELLHFLQEVHVLYRQLAWKSCEYVYARAGNLGWWHLTSKEVGQPEPQLEDIVTFCGKSPQHSQYRCARWKLWPCSGRPQRVKLCSTCYWRWKLRERERATQTRGEAIQ